jgi:hypothetical protein
MDDFKQFYRRYLPHFHQDGATYFVTTRLNDSLPKEVILTKMQFHRLDFRISLNLRNQSL